MNQQERGNQNASAPGSAACGHQLSGDHTRVAGVQDELWKAVIILMAIRCWDFHARILPCYVFVLFDTSETSFVFISMPCAQTQFEKFAVIIHR